MPDHTHLFVGLKPAILIDDFAKKIEVESNEFMNRKKWIDRKFSWQEGYGVFSYSQSHVHTVMNYVLNQERHHQLKSFRQEYEEFLERFEVPYDENIYSIFLEHVSIYSWASDLFNCTTIIM
ncbi:MAG: transposase [Cyclobacteriaceae bacterium]|nr:transposase [Cyclobacteriaceae bacterium]